LPDMMYSWSGRLVRLIRCIFLGSTPVSSRVFSGASMRMSTSECSMMCFSMGFRYSRCASVASS